MTYRVIYERDESGRWVASVSGVRGCHTQGRTIDEARRRIREALSLFVKDAAGATLEDDIRLPGDVRRLIAKYWSSRHQAETLEARAAAAARRVVEVLQDEQVSTRDTAALLHLSHQRVHQLATEKRSRRRAKKDVA